MIHFESSAGLYRVTCPKEIVCDARAYVDNVESLAPYLKTAFCPLTPSYSSLEVHIHFGSGNLSYKGNGYIAMKIKKGYFQKPKKVFGGLFHETAHGFVENYVNPNKRPRVPAAETPIKQNVHPKEALVTSLQIEALSIANENGHLLAGECARTYANPTGTKPKDVWLRELMRIRKETGEFGPILALYQAMAASDEPAFECRSCYIAQVNKLWERKGWDCRLKEKLPLDGLRGGNESCCKCSE